MLYCSLKTLLADIFLPDVEIPLPERIPLRFLAFIPRRAPRLRQTEALKKI
jgi:hypothetical protein